MATHSVRVVSPRAHLHVVGTLRLMSLDINQPSLLTSFILFIVSISVSTDTRKENTVLNSLHIGHSYLTHSFILRKEEAPVRVACNVLTVKHILTECADLLEIRKKDFEEKSLYSLFRNVIPEMIFDFLREIGVCFTKYEAC